MKSLILLTGFGPYGNFAINLSSEIVKKFSCNYEEFLVVKKIIPVSWELSIRTYKKGLLELESKPRLVILLGIHSSKMFHLERIGWNFKIGGDIDNKFKFGPINVHFKPWFKTTLKLYEIYSIVEDKRKVSISHFAGYYLCNYLYYLALHLANKEYPVIFIHVPQKGDITESIKKIDILLKAIIKTHFN